MFKTITAAAAVVVAFAAPAAAWEGHVIKCYDKIWVPAEYKTTKIPHTKAVTKWEHCGDQLCEVHYPAMYKEMKTLVTPGHYVKREAACRN